MQGIYWFDRNDWEAEERIKLLVNFEWFFKILILKETLLLPAPSIKFKPKTTIYTHVYGIAWTVWASSWLTWHIMWWLMWHETCNMWCVLWLVSWPKYVSPTAEDIKLHIIIMTYIRAQELCKSRGRCPRLSVRNTESVCSLWTLSNFKFELDLWQSSRALWKSRWPSWAPCP